MAVALSGPAAAAGVTIDTAPASPTTSGQLSWTFTPTTVGVSSCELTSGSTVIAPLADCTSPASYNVTAQGPATYTFTVYDAAAASVVPGTTAQATSNVVYDVPPAAPVFTTVPTSPGNTTAPQWSFTLPAGTTGQCTLTFGGAVVQGPTSCPGSFTASLGGQPDGTYTLAVVAVDSNGVASAPASSGYTLDTTPPAAPVVSAPVSPSNNRTPVFTISAEAGASLACTLTGPGVNAPVTPCGSSTTVALTGLADGTYTLTVTATDAAGNTSAPGSAAYTLDTTPPAAPVVSTAVSPSNNRTPVFTISAEAGASLACTLTGPGVNAPVTPCTASTTVTLTGAPDGTYTLTVTATDAAGNTGPPGSATYTLDTTSPTAPVVTAPVSPSSNRSVTFTISAEPGASLDCTLIGPSGGAVASGACGTSEPVNLTGLPDGVYTLSVTATDPAGNVSPAGTASYTLDTTPPAAPVVTAPASPSNVTTPSFGITTAPYTTTTCTLTRDFIVVWGPARCPAGGTFSLTYGDGDYALIVTATDLAGNTGPAGTATYTLDTVAPAAPVLTPPASPSPVTNPTWVWTAEAGTRATCELLDSSGGAVDGPGPCTSPWSYDLAALADGTYTFVVRVSDPAGNLSPAASASYRLDRTAPTPPTVLPPPSPSNSRTPVWQISVLPGDLATCTLRLGSTVIFGPAACPAGGLFSLLGQPDGGYTLTVTATDRIGNVSAASVTGYILDTIPPAVPTLIYASPSPGASTAPYWGFTVESGASARCALYAGNRLLDAFAPCARAVSYDLAGRPDGTYTVWVVAVDAAGNQSLPLRADYVLERAAPPPPGVVAPPPGGFLPTWTITGQPGATFTCTLLDGATVVAGPTRCGSRASYDLAGHPAGTYTLSVTQTSSGGVTGAPARSSWVYGVAAGAGSGAGSHPRGTAGGPAGLGPAGLQPPPAPASTLAPLFLRRTHGPSSGAPARAPLRAAPAPPAAAAVPRGVAQVVSRVVSAVSSSADKGTFPLLLVLLVVGFLIVQNRIDRREPKLALAAVSADGNLEFGPYPSRGATT